MQLEEGGVRVLNIRAGAAFTWDSGLTMSQLSTKKKTRQYHDLLPVTRKLIRRIKKEYQNYLLEDKDIDVEKAMMANPLTCISAPSLFQMIGIYDESDVARVKTQFVKDILGNFCDKKVVLV